MYKYFDHFYFNRVQFTTNNDCYNFLDNNGTKHGILYIQYLCLYIGPSLEKTTQVIFGKFIRKWVQSFNLQTVKTWKM